MPIAYALLASGVAMMVGLRFGVFTPTEAAVVAAVYALFVAAAVYGELKFARL